MNPTGAWTKMVSDFGFSVADLRDFMLNGIDAAWIDESESAACASSGVPSSMH